MFFENHIHLYGCLTPQDIFHHLEESQRYYPEKFDWFRREYHKAFDKIPNLEKYLEDASGYEHLCEDFLIRDSLNFDQFQAKFNLSIATFPIEPRHALALETILKRYVQEHFLAYAEFRMVMPYWLDVKDLENYFTSHAQTALEYSCSTQTFRLAVSIPRNESISFDAYQKFRHWLEANPSLAKAYKAIDFCSKEEGHPPDTLRRIMEQVKKDNQKPRAHKLAVLCHVGETFLDKSQLSAIRWIFEIYQLGIDRLGHALALGLSPECDKREEIREQIWEWHQTHHLFLELFKIDLKKALHFDIDPYSKEVIIKNDSSYKDMVRTIQHRMCEYLNEQENCVIEVCPTSNSRLGYVKQREHHSLPTFLKYPRLNLLISSDDPGIFDTSILKELELAKNYGDMNQNHFVKILDNSKKFSSEYLTQ